MGIMDSANHPAAAQPETRHVRVTGLVQGVGFRYATLRHARLLDVHGWVRNCADGSVEAMIQGSRQQLDLMQRWMRHGPRTAQVQSLSAATIETGPIFSCFEQHPTA
jgi:acylphosphatase